MIYYYLVIVFFDGLISNLEFLNCVDPFHEVKSKREKKKEVCLCEELVFYLNSFDN